MLEQGADREKILAAILGCMNEFAGIKNIKEAEATLSELGIPQTHNITRLQSGMLVRVSSDSVEIEFSSDPYEGVSVRKTGFELPIRKSA